MMKTARLFCILSTTLLLGVATGHADSPRETLAKALVAEDGEEQAKLVSSLAGSPAPEVAQLLKAWKEGAIYLYDLPQNETDGAPTDRIPITLAGEPDAAGKKQAERVDTAQP